MNDTISYPLPAGDAPVDISFVFEEERPAGRHGRLTVAGDRFVFEDGYPGRFWGVALNASACFPPHDHAEKLARRLAMTGVNIVRLHQMDAEYAMPNLFRFSRGQILHDTRSLDPRSMERLDYLVKCLKDEGVYIYMDLLAARVFKEGDGVENALSLLPGGARPYAMFDRRLIDLQKEFAEQIMTHVNPYTGFAYKDEPAVVMTDIFNECTLFVTKTLVEPYASRFKELFRTWLREKGIPRDEASLPDFNTYDDPDFTRFKIEMEVRYFREMYDYLRSIGVKCLICGSNYIYHSGFFASNSEMDFRDNHMYLHRFFNENGTTWREKEDHKIMPHFSLTSQGDCGFTKLLHMRSLDKPFFVSEWNMTWPNEYRAEGPLLYAAVGALQGIGGISIHTYSYQSVQRDGSLLGKETFADALGSRPYREGVFSAWNDPAIYGLFYHAALILRRGDVAESQKKIAVVTDPLRSRERAEIVENARPPLDWYKEARFDRMAPCYYCLAEVSKTGTCLEAPADADKVFTQPEWGISPEATEVRSDTGELYRTWKDNYGTIDSGRTKSVYGFLRKNGTLRLNGLSVRCDNEFATITLSSLSGDDLDHSDNILLTAVGRARNKDAEFDGDRMVKWGEYPTQVEVIHADVELKTDHPAMSVYSIATEGMIQGTVPSVWKDGVLSFTLGDTWRSMYYLIQAT